MYLKWFCLFAAVAFAAADELSTSRQQQQQSNIPSGGQNVQQQSRDRDVSSQCLRCLCEGSTNNCDRNAGCDNQGFCGPFRISRHYWEEAGSFGDDFQRCAKDYSCAERTVKAYMEKYGTDCDGDGDTDCQDFALIHHKGRHGCPYSDFASDSLYKYVTECMKKQDSRHQEKGGLLGAIMPSSSISGQSRDQQQQQGVNVGQQQRQGPMDFIKDKAHGLKDNIQSGVESMKPDEHRQDQLKDEFQSGMDSMKPDEHRQDQLKDKFQSGMDSIKPDQHRHEEHLHGDHKQQQQQFPSVDSKQDRHFGQDSSSQLNPEKQQQNVQQQQDVHKDRKDDREEQRLRESPLVRQRRHLFA